MGEHRKDRTERSELVEASRKHRTVPGSPDRHVSPPVTQISEPADPLERPCLLRIATQRHRLTPAFRGEAAPPRIRNPDLHRPKTGGAQRPAMPGHSFRTIGSLAHSVTRGFVTCNILASGDDSCNTPKLPRRRRFTPAAALPARSRNNGIPGSPSAPGRRDCGRRTRPAVSGMP